MKALTSEEWFESDNCKHENLWLNIEEYVDYVLNIAAEKAEIAMKKKSQYGKYRKWQNVKTEEEVDLFSYEVQYFVNKSSIINCLKD